MRAIIQRVSSARVTADNYEASIGRGFLVLLGMTHADDAEVAGRLAAKIAGLRLFEDEAGKMNHSLADVGGEVLCLSQFTLYADMRRGNRPSFAAAAQPDSALPLYEAFCSAIESTGLGCKRGVFGARMSVSLFNDGPVTVVLDSDELTRPRRT